MATKPTLKKTSPQSLPKPGQKVTPNPNPTPDPEQVNDMFLYRNKRQIGLNWDLIKERHYARLSEDEAKAEAEKEESE
jgi:hypothetical protein